MKEFKRGAVLALPLLASLADGATIKNFKFNPPRVPGDRPDLIVERLWDFPFEDKPTQIKFVPGSNQVITVHKTGAIRLYPSINAAQGDFKVLLDINPDVWSVGDHGLISIQFHPDWATGVKKAFIFYSGEPKSVAALPNNAAVTPLRPANWGNFNAGPKGGYRWYDNCPCLDCCVGAECAVQGGENRAGNVCEHPYYLDRLAMDLDGPAPKATIELTLLQASCGSSTTHGPGDMQLINGDLVFTNGDGSQYVELDYGFEREDGCYEPNEPMPQGVFRSVQDNFMNGKVVRIPKALLDSPVQITHQQVAYVGKGLRNPFRTFYHEAADELYIADVGFGDGGMTERIFKSVGLGTQANPPNSNFGWPCIEGVRSTILGPFNPWDSASENERQTYLTNEGYNTCQAIGNSVRAYVAGQPPPANGDPAWQAPLFEYRQGVLDQKYPRLCNNPYGAITSVFYYDDDKMPEEFRNKLMFSDYAKQCVWTFENNAAGKPDFTKRPNLLLSGSGFVSMTKGPDGYIYGIDYQNGRLLRLLQRTADMPEDATPPPTVAETVSPAAVAAVKPAGTCFDPKNVPILKWGRRLDGSYEGTIKLGAVTIQKNGGTMRTRAWNDMIPGPTISMKACGTYHLNVVNDMDAWPSPEGDMNSMHDPSVTNVHVHGLHVSGEAPGDDVASVIERGETGTYTYAIPCDHTGGTNWYHPHHHGSSALQTGGGAAGMLIIESSTREAQDMPPAIAALPEQFLVIQEFAPVDLSDYAVASGDVLFETTINTDFTLVNGCENVDMTVEAGQWTRVHIMNSGHAYNSILTINAQGAGAQCDISLLSKDGVWVSPAPRPLPTRKMFFSLSSRIDIAIRCPQAGSKHTLIYQHIGDTITENHLDILGTITAAASGRPAAADLPAWEPCRPAYLMDTTKLAPAEMAPPFALEVREAMNGQGYSGPDNFFATMELNKAQQWSITGSNQHPLHVHVNHMQLSARTNAGTNWGQIPGWFVAGDWVDTLSALNTVFVNIRPERFEGRQYLHCHVSAHADLGVMAVINIEGNGSGALDSPAITNYGTCPAALPQSTPYGAAAAAVPGTFEIEAYDLGGEGVGYHNINIDTATVSAGRAGVTAVEAVEIAEQAGVTSVNWIRGGEWLMYSVNVAEAGYYTATLSQSSIDPPFGMGWSLWVDLDECPSPARVANRVGAVTNAGYAGTGAWDMFENSVSTKPGPLTVGPHKLLLCFDVDSAMRADTLTLAVCGDSVVACGGDIEAPIEASKPPIAIVDKGTKPAKANGASSRSLTAVAVAAAAVVAALMF